MQLRQEQAPPWRWWVQTGQRLNMGLDVMRVFAVPTGRCVFSRGLERIRQGLGRGSTVREAFAGSGWQLPTAYWSLLEAGERTGTLGDSMMRIGRLMAERADARKELLGQLWYPAMVSLVAVGVMLLLVLWVIPQLREVLAGLQPGQPLPWVTRHIGSLYGFGLGVIIAICFLGSLVHTLWVAAGRRWLAAARSHEVFVRGLPWVGGLRARLREARVAQQLATYCTAGVTLPDALSTLGCGTPDLWERHQLMQLRQALLLGEGFGPAFSHCEVFQQENSELLSAGQEAGQLEHYLAEIALQLEQDCRWRLRQWVRCYEPALLFLLAGGVGGLLLAYLLPMVRIFENFGGF